MYCPNPQCSDVERSGTPGEYRDEITVCPVCGSYLTARLPEWAMEQEGAAADQPRDSYEFERFVPVLSIRNRGLLPLVHSLLSSNGIRYFIQNEVPLHRMPMATFAKLLVEPSRAEDAFEILSELDQDPA